MPMAPSTIRSLGEVAPSRPKTELGMTCGAASATPSLAALLRKLRRLRFGVGDNALGPRLGKRSWLEKATCFILLTFSHFNTRGLFHDLADFGLRCQGGSPKIGVTRLGL